MGAVWIVRFIENEDSASHTFYGSTKKWAINQLKAFAETFSVDDQYDDASSSQMIQDLENGKMYVFNGGYADIQFVNFI